MVDHQLELVSLCSFLESQMGSSDAVVLMQLKLVKVVMEGEVFPSVVVVVSVDEVEVVVSQEREKEDSDCLMSFEPFLLSSLLKVHVKMDLPLSLFSLLLSFPLACMLLLLVE